MEPKIISLFATTYLLFVVPLFAQTNFTKSPFNFLTQLEGSRKGVKVKGINELKSYLQRFGYLSYTLQQVDDDDDDEFDEVLESAIKTYQHNFNLTITGTMNSETILAMDEPRCGVPNTIYGQTRMRSLYAFFDGSHKWPPSKTTLTYAFAPGTRTDAMIPVAQAYSTWASFTKFTFINVGDYSSADLKFSFPRGDHGDGHPFDGPKGVLAHSYAPTDGRFHYDADESWAVVGSGGHTKGAFDLGTTALHEIGHVLGLQHTSVKEAIMFPTITPGKVKGLSDVILRGFKLYIVN